MEMVPMNEINTLCIKDTVDESDTNNNEIEQNNQIQHENHHEIEINDTGETGEEPIEL